MTKTQKQIYKTQKENYDKQMLHMTLQKMKLLNYDRSNISKFEDILKFKDLFSEMSKSDDQKNNEQALQIIQTLYEKKVPEYLLEDHPPEIPATAQKLIRAVGNAKGNGMPAEQLDFELATLFRNNERKRQTSPKKVKRVPTFDKKFVLNDAEEKENQEM